LESIAIGRFAHQVVKIVGALVPLRAVIGGAHIAVIAIAVLFAAAFTRGATKSILTVAGHTLVVLQATLPIAVLRRAGLKARAIETVLTT
jgi:hypothetical protein